MKIIQALESLDLLNRPIVFLGSDIPNNDGTWINTIANSLTEYNGSIINPLYPVIVPSLNNPEYINITNWKMQAIKKADYLAFYFASDPIGLDILLQLGSALHRETHLMCDTVFHNIELIKTIGYAYNLSPILYNNNELINDIINYYPSTIGLRRT